jgi:hypothetical protein
VCPAGGGGIVKRESSPANNAGRDSLAGTPEETSGSERVHVGLYVTGHGGLRETRFDAVLERCGIVAVRDEIVGSLV